MARLSEKVILEPIYQPNVDRPMQIAVFGSGTGTNLKALLKAQKDLSQREHTPLFEVKVLFTDKLCGFQEISKRESIPLIHHSFKEFSKKYESNELNPYALRIAYDEENVKLLEDVRSQHQFTIDLILLAGYMRFVYPPILKRFPNKIINVHPADLTVKDTNGLRKFAGADGVLKALLHGERHTRSCVIVIDETMDTGPVLVSGPLVPYTGRHPVTAETAALHQETQKKESDWPVCIKAVELISKGKLALDKQKTVYCDKIKTGPCGVDLQSFNLETQ